MRQRAHLTNEDYLRLYRQSIEQPEQFWGEQASAFLDWFKPWDSVTQGVMHQGTATWFAGGKLNVAHNCIDRHLPARAGQVAFIWEGDDPSESKKITYAELHEKVCRLANLLKSRGVNKGDRVCIYMPMIPEAAVAMLACARIGAVHSVVFGGFSPDSLRDRILDSDCRAVITADEGVRGGKQVTPFEHLRDSLRLNRRGVLVTGLGNGTQQGLRQIQAGKGSRAIQVWTPATAYRSEGVIPISGGRNGERRNARGDRGNAGAPRAAR